MKLSKPSLAIIAVSAFISLLFISGTAAWTLDEYFMRQSINELEQTAKADTEAYCESLSYVLSTSDNHDRDVFNQHYQTYQKLACD